MTRKRQFGRLLVIAGLGCLFAGVVVLLLCSPKWYVASAIVRVEQKDIETPYFWNLFFFQKESELIRSSTVLSNAVLLLTRQPTSAPPLGFLTKLRPEEAQGKLRRLLSVSPIRSTCLLAIRVSHDDPGAAAQIANATARAYCDLPVERRWQLTPQELAVIEGRLRDEAVAGDWSAVLPTKYKALLLAARQGKATSRAEIELIDPATPPTSQITFEQRLDQLLGRVRYPLPGPPVHPHRNLCLGLLAWGSGLLALGLLWMRQRAA
jgi:capsular polysaccharide biosynthesis protein